mmetsp:Transcript_8014/g.12376  ORF Transcript_8014/g.12376 Transcript_8014/m.12376 type:complete len:135 (+) Transcript_8014:135-539(+)
MGFIFMSRVTIHPFIYACMNLPIFRHVALERSNSAYNLGKQREISSQAPQWIFERGRGVLFKEKMANPCKAITNYGHCIKQERLTQNDTYCTDHQGRARAENMQTARCCVLVLREIERIKLSKGLVSFFFWQFL